jgi:hypothetical protein
MGPGTFTEIGSSGYFLWESTKFSDPWLDFPGNATYDFYPGPAFVLAQGPVVWVSTVADPSAPPYGWYAPAAGQLAQVRTGNGHIEFANGSCAEYYVYVSVLGTFAPPTDDAGPPPPDGAFSDAPTSDAALPDAPAD